ncbi:hypothetical protein DPMN_014090 [Dreissena polymorpha]|uniref:Uncharacterized protein n=1 Tax=Dreissena polymorpha TaxID=45954 RepID=A0A9D4S4C6_DREPO|nr:hypothetical protein DPMN_014090 [Dreissena polymorpha]
MKHNTLRVFVPCVVPGCAGSTGYRKRHAYKYHKPVVFEEHLPAFEDAVVRRHVAALRKAAMWLLSKVATLNNLVKHVAI